MNSQSIYRAFSIVMLLVMMDFQAFSLSGGPYELGTVSDPYRNYDGTYSMTLVPEENLLDENIDNTKSNVLDLPSYDVKNPGSALGFAYFLAPAGGIARGNIGLFYNGRLLVGNLAGAIRPSDGAFSFLCQLLSPSPDNFNANDIASSTINANSSVTGSNAGGAGSQTANQPTGSANNQSGTGTTSGSGSSLNLTTTPYLAGAYADGQLTGKASNKSVGRRYTPIEMTTLDGRATIRVVYNPNNVLGPGDPEIVLRLYVTGSRQSTETDFSADGTAFPFWVNSLSNTNLALSSLNRNTSAAVPPTNTNQPERLPALPLNATTTAAAQRSVGYLNLAIPVTPGSATFVQSLFKTSSSAF